MFTLFYCLHIFPYAFWFNCQQNMVTKLWQRILRYDTYQMGGPSQRVAFISIGAPKMAGLIIGRCIFEARPYQRKCGILELLQVLAISALYSKTVKTIRLPNFFLSPLLLIFGVLIIHFNKLGRGPTVSTNIFDTPKTKATNLSERCG